MTSVSESDGNNASWLKQRTTVFNSGNNNNKPAPKVVDKELARLKNIGAVSSVWSNKFVQEDSSNSGGSNENKNKRITPPPEPPLSPRQRYLLMNNIDISPRPNADYIPGIRQSLTSPPPTSPRSPAFNATTNTRARTLSGNNKKMAEDITAALKENQQQLDNNNNTTKNNFGYFSKNSMSSLDLNEVKTSNSVRSSVTSTSSSIIPTSPITRTSSEYPSNSTTTRTPSIDEAASLWFQCETLKTQFAQSNAKLNKANEDIEFYKRQLEKNTQIARDEGKAASLWFECETLKTQFAQNNAKLNKANEDIEFYKRQMEKSAEIAREEGAAASLWFQCETLKTQFAQNNAKLNRANEDIEFYKRQLEKNTEIAREEGAAAALWFQCETLKTQFAQSNAKLNRANDDIEFYKRQLEQNGQVAQESMSAIVAEKEKETTRVRELAELIVLQDKLLGEYEINLDHLTRLTNEATYLEETEGEMEALRQELVILNTQKDLMENTILALRAELEMRNSQMKLMMAVSTEIQNDFVTYKARIDSDIKELLNQKQLEHEAELKQLQANHVVTSNDSTSSTHDDTDKHVAAATAATTAAAAATAALVASEHEKVSDSLQAQINHLTATIQEKEQAVSEALKAKDQAIAEAFQARDKAVAEAMQARDRAVTQVIQEKDRALAEMENRLKTQKMTMDAQMMELNQTILEKDTLLMEFMSSRNNSREVISAAASMSPTTTAVPAAAVTNTYFHPHENESRLHINQIREYMFSSSEDEEEAEVLMLSYSSDEDYELNQQPYHSHYRHIVNAADTNNSTPQSPADTISSSVSFDSDEEEQGEKIAEIKHFSYSSVQSQATRPISLVSTSESLNGNMDTESNQRSSLRNSSTSYSVAKESKTSSWPMPPPTPPPSEPLPPVPVLQVGGEEKEVVNVAQETRAMSPIAPSRSTIPPPRRARSKTMARDEAPDMSVYTTSVHQNNELPRIVPLQRPMGGSESPVPAPRKDIPILSTQQAQHTKWMDDPESEEDELWCEANATPKQLTPGWNVL